MEHSDYTIKALAMARDALKRTGTDRPEWLSNLYADYATRLAVAFEALDNAGVFAALDEQADQAKAEDILAEAATAGSVTPGRAARTVTRKPDYDTDLRDARSAIETGKWSPDVVAAAFPEPEKTGDEWTARARAIESLRPRGRFHDCDSLGHLRCSDYRV